MVIETYKDAPAVYQRFRERGRMMPDGVVYIGSWVEESGRRCYQIMEADAPDLLDQWMTNWRDLVDFEVVPVVTSAEASRRLAPT
jgi:Protein of unknown function (DUF3303)